MGDRAVVLDLCDWYIKPIPVHLAKSEETSSPLEQLFRSVLMYLFDCMTNEYIFTLQFFKNHGRDSFLKSFSRALGWNVAICCIGGNSAYRTLIITVLTKAFIPDIISVPIPFIDYTILFLFLPQLLRPKISRLIIIFYNLSFCFCLMWVQSCESKEHLSFFLLRFCPCKSIKYDRASFKGCTDTPFTPASQWSSSKILMFKTNATLASLTRRSPSAFHLVSVDNYSWMILVPQKLKEFIKSKTN